MPCTIDKPAGLTVFPPHDDPAGECVLTGLLEAEPWRNDIDWPEGFEGGLAHRLDTWTSGALLVADTVEELDVIRELFAQQAFVKTYRLRSSEDVDWERAEIDSAIAHHPKNKRKMVCQRGPHSAHRGQWYEAETRFARLAPNIFEARMRSGVMHQIRVHAAEVGLPILGDRLYGGGSLPDEEPGFLLHHVGIKLVDPSAHDPAAREFETEPVPLPDWARTPDDPEDADDDPYGDEEPESR